MLFVDYNFDLLPNGSIWLDPELRKEDIHVEPGDMFRAEVDRVTGRILLRKIDTHDTD
jgi:hypothetical protein